jgi:hypothetical protein
MSPKLIAPDLVARMAAKWLYPGGNDSNKNSDILKRAKPFHDQI